MHRRENWRTHIEAVTATPSQVEEYHHFFYDQIHAVDPIEYLETITDRWDLIVIDQISRALPAIRWRRLMDASLQRAAYVLVLTPIAAEVQADESPSLAASDLLASTSVRHVLEMIDGQDYGGFLFSGTDPRGLRTPPRALSVFSQFRTTRGSKGSQRSGPGSSLVQTATIRRDIPALLASLGIRSFLDAPCGDFNWMRHVDLGVERYIEDEHRPRDDRQKPARVRHSGAAVPYPRRDSRSPAADGPNPLPRRTCSYVLRGRLPCHRELPA